MQRAQASPRINKDRQLALSFAAVGGACPSCAANCGIAGYPCEFAGQKPSQAGETEVSHGCAANGVSLSSQEPWDAAAKMNEFLWFLRTGLSTIGETDASGQSCMHNFFSAWTEVKSLLRNPLYVVVTMGMSALYFVVTGVATD